MEEIPKEIPTDEQLLDHAYTIIYTAQERFSKDTKQQFIITIAERIVLGITIAGAIKTILIKGFPS